MMNKKGISIGRILLYLLFVSLIGLVIYSLYLTYKEIKKPKEENISSIRMVNYNDSINLFNSYAYPFVNKNDDGVYVSTRLFTGCFTYLDVGTYTISFSSLPSNINFACFISSTIGYDATGITYDSSWQTLTPFTFSISSSGYFGIYIKYSDGSSILPSVLNGVDIMLNSGSSASPYVSYSYDNMNTSAVSYFATSYLSYSYFSDAVSSNGLNRTFTAYNDPYTNNLYTSSVSSRYNVVDLTSSLYDLTTYCSDFSSTIFDNSNCFSITLTGNIPIELFNFSITGNGSNFSNSIFMTFVTDKGSSSYFFNSSSFKYGSIMTGVNSTATIIKSFTLYFYTSSSSYQPYYVSLPCTNKDSFGSIHLVFDFIPVDDLYLQGYLVGLADGRSEADSALQNSVIEMNNTINSLNSDINSLRSQINQQNTIIDNLQSQLNNSQSNFKGLFFTFADIPFRTVANVLGFEFWGVNLFRFFVGAITALGIVWLVKRFI